MPDGEVGEHYHPVTLMERLEEEIEKETVHSEVRREHVEIEDDTEGAEEHQH